MSQYYCDAKDIKVINFGEVEMGRTIIKSIKIMNESCREQFYEAQRDPVTNPIDHVFNLKSYTWTLLPEQSFSCEVQYRPVVPCSTNVDYFIITGTASTYIKIITHGTSIGPKISSSANKIILKCSKKYTQVKKKIKLTNHSKVKAVFIFDIDIEQKYFKLDIRQGIVNPCDYKYITITFIPTKEGVYVYHLPCLILYQWDQDVTGVFKIEPCIAKICPNHSALFEIIFQPSEENNLYTKQFIGYFFDDDPRDEEEEENKVFVIPSFTSIRVIGHSFPTSSAGWIPQYELPSTIVLPPCIPPLPVYTTFIIKKFGHLPLMFHFLPPADSHFVVKPMLGIIYEDYQVVVVQMCPEVMGEHLYMEQWAICFNGNPKNKDYISFKGYTEYANISFNKSTITFATVHLDTQQKEQILIRNLTRHIIMYEFLDVPSQLIIPHLKGQIYANDIHSHEWVFHPTECGEYNFDIKCILMAIQNDLPVGAEVSITLNITGKCEAGLLVAIPYELNFDVQLYGNKKTKSFYLYNFSSVNIPFKIICCHLSWPVGYIEHDVKIYPLSETVLPGKSKKILVSITPYTPGFYEIVIKYMVRINSWTDNISSIQLPQKVCNVYCMCELPTLKIEDVHFYGVCPPISKINLWKIIDVNKHYIKEETLLSYVSLYRLNITLKNILPYEKESQYIFFPPMILHENPICIKLCISNPTSVNTTWDIKRMQLCFCKTISKSRGLSFRYMEFDCIHKKVCSIYPQSGFVKPKEKIIINIQLRYLLLGQTTVKWDLNIGHERHIFLYMQIEALSGSEKELYLLYPQIVKLDTYFSDKKAQHQICWIYNYTSNYLPYSVDITDLHKINQIYHSEILACLNPDGIVEPQSLTPLILKYHLKQFTAIEAYLSITFGDKKRELFISSQPSIVYPPRMIKEILPNCDTFEIKESPICFSTDYIHLYTSIHSCAVKMFMMYNTSNYNKFAYTWKKFVIINSVSELWNIEVHPQKGIIKPHKIQSFRITINTKSLTCQVNVSVICEFLNITQRRIIQRNIYKYHEICKKLESEFIFTEKGEHFPQFPSKPEEKPDIFCKTLSIHCNIYSSEDILLRTKLIEELKMVPTDELQIQNNIKSSNNYEHTKMMLFILEGMTW
ncbi:cilia- and flagella-associated protein 65-like [Vespula squamosa]|uniref:Cilia- and flagella-associated protein 65-like n=1 Tax=Vespula squamosa TaxID=30214 RepID=A0ABD2AJL5_VESSQ